MSKFKLGDKLVFKYDAETIRNFSSESLKQMHTVSYASDIIIILDGNETYSAVWCDYRFKLLSECTKFELIMIGIE